MTDKTTQQPAPIQSAELAFRSRVADLLHLLPMALQFDERDRATAEAALADIRRHLAAAPSIASQRQVSAGEVVMTESQIAEAVRDWFPDRAYQAEYFARAVATGQAHWTKRNLPAAPVAPHQESAA